MKIVVFEVEPWECSHFERLSADHEVIFVSDPLNIQNIDQYIDAEIVSVFIYSQLSRGILDRFRHLQFIATRSTGFDHIDMAHCSNLGIAVSNVPSYGEHTVAEHVFGLLLMISHRLAESIDRTRKGDFSQKGLRGFDLQGKTLGVVGTGAIGRHVMEIAHGFRMNVLAFDLKHDPDMEAKLGFHYAAMDELLKLSDIVTLHIPYTEATHHLIDTDEFAKMKQGIILINTSRGAIVNIEALLRALADGKVSAAGLDVLPEEPIIREEAELLSSFFRKTHDMSTLLADHILLRMRNVYITPHNAFNTREAVERILDTTVNNINAYLSGYPQNTVRKN